MTAREKCFAFARRAGPSLVLALLLAVFIRTGWIGRDFGYHWDEYSVFDEIIKPLENGVFLPREYHYPSMMFDIGTVVLLPKTIPFLYRAAMAPRQVYEQPYQEVVPKQRVAPLVAFVKSHSFLLQLRSIFLVITSLAGVWVFLAVRACKRSGWEAAFAAAVVLTSWEIAYHARWIAADDMQMQFVALWLMFFALALHSSTRSLLWLRLSVAAAGLACGTKYQGGIFLVPSLIYSAIVVRASAPSHLFRSLAKELTFNLAIFTAVFVITTPGALLEPLIFFQSLRHIGHAYAREHGGDTVNPGIQHAYLLLCYLTCALTSHWLFVALILSAAACLGAAMMWKEQPLATTLLLCAPVAYFFFVICYRVMIVRNYLLFVPFVAFLAARGAFHIWKALSGIVWLRLVVVTCFAAIFAGNALFLWNAAQTIAPHASRFGADLVAYLKKHPKEQYFLSKRVAQTVAGERVTLSNTTQDPNMARRYILFTGDAPRTSYSCNRFGQYKFVTGPLEVNFDYYADWQGAGRVVDLSMQRAREMKLLPKP